MKPHNVVAERHTVRQYREKMYFLIIFFVLFFIVLTETFDFHLQCIILPALHL